MKCSVQTRRFYSILFLVGYIFVAFFAQQFHTHDHPFEVSESDKTIVESAHDHESDCLACHFIHEVKYLSYGQPNYDFYIPKQYSKIEVTNDWIAPLFTTDTSYLRGPPTRG